MVTGKTIKPFTMRYLSVISSTESGSEKPADGRKAITSAENRRKKTRLTVAMRMLFITVGFDMKSYPTDNGAERRRKADFLQNEISPCLRRHGRVTRQIGKCVGIREEKLYRKMRDA